MMYYCEYYEHLLAVNVLVLIFYFDFLNSYNARVFRE